MKIRVLVQAQERLDVAEFDKSRAMVEAHQRLEVAELDRQAAAEKKQEEILLGQGEAERKRLVLQADGALQEKLQAYVQAQQVWASAYAQRQVPTLVMGGGGTGDTDLASTDFAQMMQLMVAQQMGLDLSVPQGANAWRTIDAIWEWSPRARLPLFLFVGPELWFGVHWGHHSSPGTQSHSQCQAKLRSSSPWILTGPT